ncbi:hypothetical protein CF335_g426 [Tilletia laevis]|nr:hypothetical protein CF335_g426 [Tilletia laevis]
MRSTPPALDNEPSPKRAKTAAASTMIWLSMAPETDPAALPIQDHGTAPNEQDEREQHQRKSAFVGVGAPDMLIPFNMRSRTASAGASSGGSPSLNLGRSIASLRMSSSSTASPAINGLSQQGTFVNHQDQQGDEDEEEEDESDEEPCCTPDHALANDAMVLLASSSTSTSSFRDTSVGLPPQSTHHHHHHHHHYNNVGTSAVKLVKTPAATSSRRRVDYFTAATTTTEPSSDSNSTITSSRATSPPDFDFRNTFAPLAFNRGAGGLNSSSCAAASTASASKINGGGGIEFAGRQWSGKTAHAVELEMEALGDRAIMSFAPDASYLASRLEMLRKNLEGSGWERRPNWVHWEDEEDQKEEQEMETEDVEEEQEEVAEKEDETLTTDDKPTETKTKSPTGPVRLRPHPTTASPKPKPHHHHHQKHAPRSEFSLPPAPATSLIDAEYARATRALPSVSNIEGASLSAAERSRIARASFLPAPAAAGAKAESRSRSRMREGVTVADVDEEGEEEEVEPQMPPPLEPAVRAAALDARLEIRQLKRDDVVQVRELHCFHGDGNKSPGRETYTMSAGFLLRLLVDEKHVAVVAVKRPIPAPESPLPSDLDLANSIHSRFSPSPMGASSPSRTLNRERVGSSLARTVKPDGRGEMYEVARSSSSMEAEAEDDDEEEEGEEEGEDIRSDAGSGSSSPSSFSSSADEVSPRTEFTRATSLSDRGAQQQQRQATTTATTATTTRMLPRAEDRSNLPAHGRTLPPSVLPQSDSTFYERDADKPFLAGPLPVAPPLAVRVMAAPPPGHRLRSFAMLEGAENVVGVATAQLTTTEPLANELWPGIDFDDTSARGAAVEQAHVLTLSVAPDERSQGLGARLLERLLEECEIRIGHNSLRRPPQSISVSGRAKSMRAVVECHPSNERAIGLYEQAGFRRVQGPQGTRKNFYRGDERIPLAYRLRVGGTDAHVFERRSDLP